jgi:hypothetical protein
MGMNGRLLRPKASGFNPKSIAGLQAWWDFSDASTLGPTSSGVGTVTNNGLVKFVADKSTSGFNLTATHSDANSPSFVASSLNGKSALSFDGGDVINAPTGAIMTAPFTLFIVCRANVTGNARVCGVGSARSLGPFAASNTQWGFFNAGGVLSFGATATSASVLAVTCTSGLAGVLWGNGTRSATGTLSSLTPGSFGVGGDVAGTSGTLNGVAYECLSYSSALSSSQVTIVSRWLGAKWGITVA